MTFFIYLFIENEIMTLNENKSKVLIKKYFEILFINSNFINSKYFVNNFILFFTIIPLLWLIVYLFNENYALPGGIYYSLWILFTFGHIFGFLFSKIRLPGLLGMSLFFIFHFNRVSLFTFFARHAFSRNNNR
jgi:hypothetical protein